MKTSATKNTGVAPIGAPTLTLAITPPSVTLQAPPPALISSDFGGEYLGLSHAALVDVFAEMRRDPDFAERVIVMSRKRVAASPEDMIAFLRARYSAKRPTASEPAEAPPANDAADGGVDSVLALVGAERVRGAGKRGAR
jgi:hypothetical protein